jgi:manganese/zinc/iron transport system ATP- binding protein
MSGGIGMDTKPTGYAVEVEDLTVAYDAKPVLWDIDLKIPKGRRMAVVGPNGAGKTTLIKAMLGLLTPVSGSVRFIDGAESAHTLKNRIGYVPQSGSVDWDFPATALDVVLMGTYGRLGWIRRPGRAQVELARQTLGRVGMEEYAFRQISRLSGGQQQRVFLARALAQQAEVYFMDEPFKGVDAKTERAIVLLLKELNEQGSTVVVVHHDLQTVADYFDWVTLINLRVVASGPVREVFHEENLKKTYRSSGALLKGAV